MDFELFCIPDCPSTAAAKDTFARALALEGITQGVHLREITSEAEAEALEFRGSPTFRAWGRDLFPGTGRFGLACRLYRQGQVLAGAPSLEDVQVALRAALAAQNLPGNP